MGVVEAFAYPVPCAMLLRVPARAAGDAWLRAKRDTMNMWWPVMIDLGCAWAAPAA